MKNLRENFLQGQEKSGQQEKPESPSEDGRAYSQKGEGRIIPIIKYLVVNDRKSTYCKLGDACDVVRRKTCQHKK
jgi:hypothetical protein